MTAQIPQNNQPEESRKDFEIKLLNKAGTDEAFRQQLLSNPKAVVEQELGEALPKGMDVKIIQEPANTLYIVLPTKTESSSSDGLNDEELEAVAGGMVGIPAYGVTPVTRPGRPWLPL